MEKLISRSKLFFRKNSATILTCIGSAGVVVTTVMAVKATPKALALIEAAEKEKGEKLTRLETIETVGMTYAPSAIAGIATIGCIFGANVLNKRTQAALTSAYALLDSSYRDYKKKVEELYGEDTNEEIKADIAKDKYPECDIEVSKDAQLFYDFYSGQYFESTMADVLKAEYELNRKITVDTCAYLNDWYEELGLAPIDGGYEIGWSRDFNQAAYWQEWVDFRHTDTALDEGLDCCIITILQEPSIHFADDTYY